MKCLSRKAAGQTVSSPPSRGAWIEIEAAQLKRVTLEVAPLAGGVD